MARRSKGELSQHPTKGYRVCVGTREGEDGKLRPAVFWLGHDLETARLKASMYRRTWDDPDRGGTSVVVRVDEDRDAVGGGADDRAGKRELEPAQRAVGEHLAERRERFSDLHRQSIAVPLVLLKTTREDSPDGPRLVGVSGTQP